MGTPLRFVLRHPRSANQALGEGEATRPEQFGRVAGAGEDPLTWAIPVGTWRGVRLGVHVIFPIWALAEGAAALPAGLGALGASLLGVLCYAAVAVMRELARAWWAARAGRDVHEVVVWPLGGLASFGAGGPGATALGELGGLMFTGILVFPLAGFLWTLGASGMDLLRAIVSPAASLAPTRDGVEAIGLWLFHACVVMTALHALAPMAPFDAGRALDRRSQARHSPVEAAGSSFRRGVFVAFALFTGAAVAGHERLMAVGVLGGLTTWIEYRRVMFLHRPLLHTPLLEDRTAGVRMGGEVHEQGLGAEAPSLDDVLAKITRSGMPSLTALERRVLEDATRSRRGSEDERPLEG